MANAGVVSMKDTGGVLVQAATPAPQTGDPFPAGVLMSYAGGDAPTGWLICDGSAISRATFPALFTAIGTTYGAGDGSTTFNLPDCRGRLPVGKHSSGSFTVLGATGGVETYTAAIADLPSHNHGGATGTGTSGSTTPANTGSETANHGHSLTQSSGNVTVSLGIEDQVVCGPIAGGNMNSGSPTHVHASSAHTHSIPALSISSQGGGGAHNNKQPYIVLQKMIRAY